MSIKDLKITDQNVQNTYVQSQPDRLTGTAQQNKAVFDAFPQLIRQRFNALLEALTGTSAAGEIPVGPIEGVTAETVQQALEAIQQNLTAYINKIKAATGAAEVGVSPIGGIEADNVQEALQALRKIQSAINQNVQTIMSEKGAAAVGVSTISGMQAQNVQQALAELRKAIDNIVSGIIPGGSITADMIVDGAIVQLGALLAVAAAAAYDPEGSYAVGDYCTHGGGLHKCNTAIPSGEAWNAEHWTATTVAAELAEVRASLSNKVSRAGELVPLGTNILTLAPGRYSVDGVSDTDMANSMNLPVTTWHYEIDVIAAANATGLVSNYKVIIVYPSSNVVLPYINIMNYEGKWTGWTQIPTATPPEMYNLPLADGFSVWGVCSYFKTQDNIVTLNVNLSHTLVTAGNDVIIGNLPVGFRPIGHVIAAAYCNGAGYIFIDYHGVIRMRGDADWTVGNASVTFLAP